MLRMSWRPVSLVSAECGMCASMYMNEPLNTVCWITNTHAEAMSS